MLRFLPLSIIFLAVIINQLQYFGLFKKIKPFTFDAIQCERKFDNLRKAKFFEGITYHLTDRGLSDLQGRILYESQNAQSFAISEGILYLVAGRQLHAFQLPGAKFIETQQWAELGEPMAEFDIPFNFNVIDLEVFNGKLLLIQDYGMADLLNIFFRRRSFAVLECSLDMETCQVSEQLKGVFLSSLLTEGEKLYVADTFGNEVVVYDKEYRLVAEFRFEGGGPTKITKSESGMFVTVIPKLTELLYLKKHKSIIDLHTREEWGAIEHWFEVGYWSEGLLVLGDYVCSTM